MPNTTIPSFANDREVWASLKKAIAASSGFGRWQNLKAATDAPLPANLDEQVTSYLRETLATLAY